LEQLTTDVLILGAGLSGLYTALNIDESKQVLIIAKEPLGISNSSLAQGGIAGEMEQNEELLAKHIEDTLVAGAGLYDPDAIRELVYAARENIQTLIQLGVPFDVDQNGKILLTKEGGHSKRRILHAGGDATGREIMITLARHIASRKNVTIIENYMFYDLIHQDNICYGGKIINKEGDIKVIFSKETVVATGGIGAVYKDSTNSHGATGDGIAACFRAKVDIRNMEFVQFHPTVFYDVEKKLKGQKFLISEAIRGEGAYLRNIEGERFMTKYHDSGELAPRDIVSQAIHREMYDTWSEYVLLDVRHLDVAFLKTRFPTIYQKCLESRYQMENDLIPVAPVEHYGIGGISIDIDGKTSMKNLYANGECSNSGVHGANRLASNSLLECLVYGKRISVCLNGSKESLKTIETSEITEDQKPYSYHVIRTGVRNLMDQYVGVVRTHEGLMLAQGVIEKHFINLNKYPLLTEDYYRALNITTTALLIVNAALARPVSIGCHFRVN
jgi:L-aspartate oxidase